MRRPGARSESGQAAVLLVGFFAVALLLVAVVVDASAAYLRRQGLDNIADGAALAGADGVQGREVYEGGLGERARFVATDVTDLWAFIVRHRSAFVSRNLRSKSRGTLDFADR